MQKATISARSGRRSGGCNERGKRAKPDAKSDHFGAVWTQDHGSRITDHGSRITDHGSRSRLFTVAHGCPRLSTVVHGCPRLFTVVHGCSRLFTVVHGSCVDHSVDPSQRHGLRVTDHGSRVALDVKSRVGTFGCYTTPPRAFHSSRCRTHCSLNAPRG